LEVFRDFMAVPDVLEQKWAALHDDMKKGGVAHPRLAVTELQMFANVGRASSANAPVRLTHETLVNPSTQAEALYDVLIYHAAIRQAPFVEMITHSATVNHGGGLRKTHERVFANPCYYAQSMFAAFAGATPVKTDLTCATERAPMVLPDLRHVTKNWTGKALDVLAAQSPDGALLLSIVHKGTKRPVDLNIEIDGLTLAGTARIQTLSAPVPWAVNTLEAPAAIAPVASVKSLSGTALSLRLEPYSYTLVRIPGQQDHGPTGFP
jgi:alpha-N-arabinofuranosidase